VYYQNVLVALNPHGGIDKQSFRCSEQVSISPTFSPSSFSVLNFLSNFSLVRVRVCIFCQKTARKMLVKLTTVVQHHRHDVDGFSDSSDELSFQG